jgi:hypothetical protein
MKKTEVLLIVRDKDPSRLCGEQEMNVIGCAARVNDAREDDVESGCTEERDQPTVDVLIDVQAYDQSAFGSQVTAPVTLRRSDATRNRRQRSTTPRR